ncbi:hypothetical protein CAEBREN_20840 [Caenorhabditis brenneri]|uniref:G-protein coupled receptors family 1 profile domain-containing protein n=1 Tax=Caenorhabditis brenneri TaxID=135651 RepID=G0P0G5_CAEBE|nr:hypothetical protein CAEBREN_20840 [Caenorhabditis brenneri]
MLTYAIEGELILFYQNLHLCYSQTTDYWLMMARWITEYIRNYARRCSTWFSLSITILRAVVIRYPMSSTINKLSRPGAAFIIIGCIIATIIPINFIDVLRLSVNLIEENYVCEEFGYYERYYMVGRSTMFETHFELVQVWYKIIDGITSKMIPCILFPLSTFFLVWELRKTDSRRQNLGTTSTSATNSSRSTSNLVLAQTIAFFTAELPLGIIFLFQSLYDEFDYYGIYEYLILFELFFSFIQSGTTMTHMIICVLMSTQYRMNALMVVRCGYPLKPKPKNVVVFLTASSHV